MSLNNDIFSNLDIDLSKHTSFQELDVSRCATLLMKTDSVVFFTGAGFSKLWRDEYPLGFDLFAIDDIEEIKDKYNFFSLAEALSIYRPEPNEEKYAEKCYEYFSEIKFHLDIYKRYPSLMPNNLDETTLNEFESEIRLFIRDRFIKKVGEDELILDKYISENQYLSNFFSELSSSVKTLTFISTNYDFIIEKILKKANITNVDRGIVDRSCFQRKDWKKSKVNLFKINGGFEVYFDSHGFHLDYTQSDTNRASNIILPSRDQNYDNKYYKNMFVKSANKLREAQKLVFVGYSLPIEDHTIRFLIKNFIDCNSDEKEVYVINRNYESALKVCEKVGELFPTLRKDENIFAIRGTFDEVCKATSAP